MERKVLISEMARVAWESINLPAEWDKLLQPERDGLCQQQATALEFLESTIPTAQREIRRWLRFEQFRLFGCIPRCLIQWANMRRTSMISASEFIEQEADKYWSDTDRCGLASYPAQTIQIAHALGLANKFGATTDAAAAQVGFGQGGCILLFTKTTDGEHCRLVTGWSSAGEVVTWNPVNIRIDLAIPELFDATRLKAENGNFIVLLP